MKLAWALGFSFFFAVSVSRARDLINVEDLASGDVMDFPVGTPLTKTDSARHLAFEKISDTEDRAQCSVSLSGSSGPTDLGEATSWTVVSNTKLAATNEDCKQAVHAKIKDDYAKAQEVLEDSWITESPVNRSMYKRRASEEYLRKLDALSTTTQACSRLSKKEIEKVPGPGLVTMKYASMPQRKLYFVCNKNGVRLDNLAGLAGVHVVSAGGTPRSRAPASLGPGRSSVVAIPQIRSATPSGGAR